MHIESRWRQVSTSWSVHRGQIGDGNCVSCVVFPLVAHVLV